MAGSWSTLSYRKGEIDNEPSGPIGLKKTFTADASDGSVPAAEIIPDVSGLLVGVDVVFDGTAAPDSVTVSLLTIDGIVLPYFPATALTASGRIDVDPPVPICGGMKITITTAGAGDASTIASVIPLVVPL